MGKRIAIVGSGIAGLGAAWALSDDHDITVFEADSRIGGHSNTVDAITLDGPVAVDTGFIVFNEVTYPNLTRLFARLEVPTEQSDMSFAFSLDRSFEYAASVSGVLAQPTNLLRRGFSRTLLDVNRFRRVGSTLDPLPGESIEDLLARSGFSKGFLDDYLLPMAGAIWSAGRNEIGHYPAAVMMDFLANHGLIEIVGRPTWRTVTGGSREYVHRLVDPFADRVRLNAPVTSITRLGTEVLVATPSGHAMFDDVILACHSDQALRILGTDATDQEVNLLSGIPYQANTAVLHSDPELMPANRRVWASWNAMADSSTSDSPVASVSYWMNRLQNLDTSQDLFVSLNPLHDPDPNLVHGRFEYAHPQFGPRAREVQEGLTAIQGRQGTWFAGAWMGYGFHEDGVQSGLNVAAALGSPAPWASMITPKSSAPAIPPMEIAA